MPVRKTGKGYKIENVKTIFPTREKAIAALRAIKATQKWKRSKQKKRIRGGSTGK